MDKLGNLSKFSSVSPHLLFQMKTEKKTLSEVKSKA